MKGRIHSRESFGTLDGPGIRYVVFMQGCPMRCLYCHNPDTWNMSGGTPVEAEEIIREYEKNRAFYSKGGITVSGGEPLLQIDFLIELFKLADARGIHTAIDTSGITFSKTNNEYLRKLDELMKYTDLVMLDIKHIDDNEHRKLTGHGNAGILDFAAYVESRGVDLWIRHVVLQGYTDDPKHLFRLGKFIGALNNFKALDVLPYHTMGREKYREMGLEYPLGNLPPTDKNKADEARKHILLGVKEGRKCK